MNLVQTNDIPCQFCHKMISIQNKELHEVRCENLMRKNKPFDQPIPQISLKCEICHDSFNSRDQLNNHIIDCEQINMLVKCPNCKEDFPQFMMEDHQQMCEPDQSSQSDHQNRNQNSSQQKNILNEHNNDEDEDEDDEDYVPNNQEQNNHDGEEEEHEHEHEQEQEQEHNGYEEQKQDEIQYTEEQLNQILDRGEQLPFLADVDQSNTGGLSNQEIEVFPVIKYDAKYINNQDPDQNSCAICMDPYERFQFIKTLGCLHRFHKKCINHWLIKNKLCPICKIDQKQFV